MAWTREQMAQRAAKELQDGFYVNFRNWPAHPGRQLYSRTYQRLATV